MTITDGKQANSKRKEIQPYDSRGMFLLCRDNVFRALGDAVTMEYSSIRKWEIAVKDLGCIITEIPNPTIHHIHSGSVSNIGIHSGWSQRGAHPWLIIPLHYNYHTGEYGIDYGFGVKSWEKMFGTQVEFMDEVCRRLKFNAWKKAGVNREVSGIENHRC